VPVQVSILWKVAQETETSVSREWVLHWVIPPALPLSSQPSAVGPDAVSKRQRIDAQLALQVREFEDCLCVAPPESQETLRVEITTPRSDVRILFIFPIPPLAAKSLSLVLSLATNFVEISD
jgi:hypothetical protein